MRAEKFALRQRWLLQKDVRCICREFPINFNLGKNRMMSAVERTADTQKTSDKDTGDRNDKDDEDDEDDKVCRLTGNEAKC